MFPFCSFFYPLITLHEIIFHILNPLIVFAVIVVARSSDAKYLAVSSQDGYCTLLEFENNELGSRVSLSGWFLMICVLRYVRTSIINVRQNKSLNVFLMIIAIVFLI